MTIDEAIVKYKEITNTDANCPAHCNISCDDCVKESRQIAEWLEELKDYQDKNKMVVRVYVENMDSIKDKIEELSKYAESQYNKAIDDFMKALLIEYAPISNEIKKEYENVCSRFEKIAEQLKEGEDND